MLNPESMHAGRQRWRRGAFHVASPAMRGVTKGNMLTQKWMEAENQSRTLPSPQPNLGSNSGGH